MNHKNDFQKNMEEWKTISNQEEREEFLNQIKTELENKNPEEFKNSLQAVHKATVQLHKDVFEESSHVDSEQIIVTPQSPTELTALKAFLKKMNIPFKKVG